MWLGLAPRRAREYREATILGEKEIVLDASLAAINANGMVLRAAKAKGGHDLADDAGAKAQQDHAGIRFGILGKSEAVGHSRNLHNLVIEEPSEQIHKVTAGIDEGGGVVLKSPKIVE